MNEFALLFRPLRNLPAEDLARRNAASRQWALDRQKEGLLAFAAPLEEVGVILSADGTNHTSTDHPIAAVLVVRAETLETATRLARTHPGFAWGTAIELRPVKQVTPPKPE